MIKRRLLLSIMILCAFVVVWGQDEAQELNCTVEINASKVQNVNKEVFEHLNEAINEYMNTYE